MSLKLYFCSVQLLQKHAVIDKELISSEAYDPNGSDNLEPVLQWNWFSIPIAITDQKELCLTPRFYIICKLPLTGWPEGHCQNRHLSLPPVFPCSEVKGMLWTQTDSLFSALSSFIHLFLSPTAPYPSFIVSSLYLLMILISQNVKGMSELGLYTNSLAAGMVTLISTWAGGCSCCTMYMLYRKRQVDIQTWTRWEWQSWHTESLHED